MRPPQGQPGPLGPALRGNGTNYRLNGASPEGVYRVECRCAAIPHPKVLSGRLGAVLGDQADLAGPRDGLGPVGGAELAQDVGHVLFDCVERHDQVERERLGQHAERAGAPASNWPTPCLSTWRSSTTGAAATHRWACSPRPNTNSASTPLSP